jgi:hypothetical protein
MKAQTDMTEEKSEARKTSRRKFIKATGLIVGGTAAASTGLLAAAPAKTASARGSASTPTPAGPVTLELYDPGGAIEITSLHAPRLDTLAGKTICEVSNSSWEVERTFPLIRELLQSRYPTAKFIPYTKFPMERSPQQEQTIAGLLKAAGCDAVISGNAG